MFSHPELGSDPPIGSDRESGCDTSIVQWTSRSHYKDSQGSVKDEATKSKGKMGRIPPRGIMGIQNYTQISNSRNPICSSIRH